MIYMNHAVVNETCPVCGQGRVLVASQRCGDVLFVTCEDCESEWREPNESHDAALSTRNTYTFLRYLDPEELTGHQWYSSTINR